jgi:hypothetical protein
MLKEAMKELRKKKRAATKKNWEVAKSGPFLSQFLNIKVK